MDGDRIDDDANQKRVNHVGDQGHTLSDGARVDGGGGTGEGQLEEEANFVSAATSGSEETW